jgi:hypothetical protein
MPGQHDVYAHKHDSNRFVKNRPENQTSRYNYKIFNRRNHPVVS